MTVMLAPHMRLTQTLVCVEAGMPSDFNSWKKWCSSVGEKGASMISLTSADAEAAELNQALQTAREVLPTGLVVASEPLDKSIISDVIHVSRPRNAKRWKNALCGAQITTRRELRSALKAGCDYVVVDVHEESLIEELVNMSADQSPLVWFVSGCEKFADLKAACASGARRVWMTEEKLSSVERWGNHLRQLLPGLNGPLSLSEMLKGR
jgi:hypothetical protein